MKVYLLPIALISLMCLSCEKNGGGDTLPGGEDIVEYGTLQSRSAKRGVCFNFAQLPSYDFPLLGDAVSWYYDWSSNVPGAEVDGYLSEYGIDFCPMIWNGNYNPDNIRTYKSSHPEAGYILAFNEPNLRDQANMTPAAAAELWPDIVALADEVGMKLISPAMNYGTLEGYSDPWKWMDEFLQQPGVSLDDIDGIAVHCYMNTLQALKDYIAGFKKYGKPIWLTEFCSTTGGTVSEVSQMNFMVEAINYLESDDDVFRYAWFIPRGGPLQSINNELLTSRSPIELTDLGKVFVNMSTQDKDVAYGPGTVIPAEHYCAVSGAVHLRPVTDVSGILELFDLKENTWVEYLADIPEAGVYTLEFRYRTSYATAMALSADGSQQTEMVDLPDTDNGWVTGKVEIELPAGVRTIRLAGTDAWSICLNWLRLNK